MSRHEYMTAMQIFLESLSVEEILIYLRKSRQDDPGQTVEEVLERHEAMLQEHAVKNFGQKIPEKNIFREVASGERISERPEMLKVLELIERPEFKALLVVEPQRLSRGSMSDCGRIVDGLQYTETKVLTLQMNYDLSVKHERKFFEAELMRGGDYLEYIREILTRGAQLSASRGNFIGSIAPWGYNKITIDKDHTLEPNGNADTVRLIFRWCAEEGLTPYQIAARLNKLGYPPPITDNWSEKSIRQMLTNPHYVGLVRYSYRKTERAMEDGKMIKRRTTQKEDNYILVEGKHPAIIRKEVFDVVQDRLNNTPRVRHGLALKNPLAGILRCKGCGCTMFVKQAQKVTHNSFYMCPTTTPPGLKKKGRCYKGAVTTNVEEALLHILKTVELPNLKLKLENGDGDAAKIQKARVERLQKQLKTYHEQEALQESLLMDGTYSPEQFKRLNARLQEAIKDCEKELYAARAEVPRNINYSEKVKDLEGAIAAMADPRMTNEEKNKALRQIIERIDYSAVDLGQRMTEVTLEVTLRL